MVHGLGSPSLSLQNPNQLRRRHSPVPRGCSGFTEVAVAIGADVTGPATGTAGLVVVDATGSLQPQKRPGVSQVVVVLELVDVACVVVTSVDVVLSLQPNQPGVSQVEVDVEEVVVVSDSVVVVVVDASKHPHQPGVSQVLVRVRVRTDDDAAGDVVVSVPLLSYIFHWPQSRHSGVNSHFGTSSYCRRTSLITARIL